MKQTLSLRYSLQPLRDVRAWFLSGECVESWIAALLSWPVPSNAIAVRIVPRSIHDRTPLGILVTADPVPQNVSAQWQPYGCLADRLFLPVESRLMPEPTQKELQELLSSRMQYIWHPVAQLVAFETADVLSLSDLLQVPEVRISAWDRAVPGIAVPQQLVSLKAERPPSVAVFLDDGGGDIGTQADAVEELPPSPQESSSVRFRRMLGAPRRGVARMVRWIVNRPSQSAAAAGPGWIQRVQQWASSVLSSDLLDAQQRAVRRLLDMLQNDPDQGLRYALPMGRQDNAGRGLDEPRAELTQHSVDFQLNRPSGAFSSWHVLPDLRFQLTARYRELAAREQALGRHRRAAYIYAELLGDLHDAAAVLQSGGYYREAAVLYSDRLRSPRQAAICLEAGGLFEEAIELYEQLEDFDAAGRLYRRLQRPEQARAAFRLAAEKHRREGRFRKSAVLFERELDAPEAAVEALRIGWMRAADAEECLTDELQLLTRLGRHDDMADRIRELAHEHRFDGRGFELVAVFSQTAVDCPEPRIRRLAADTVRVVASRELKRLGTHDPDRQQRLLSAVQSLVPEDRLLRRDCQRFWQDSHVRLNLESKAIERWSRSGQLGSDVRWQCAAQTLGSFCAAGYSAEELVLRMVSWRNPEAVSEIRWKTRIAHGGRILLSVDPLGIRPIWIQIQGTTGPPVKMGVWALREGSQTIQAGAPVWTTRDVVAFAHHEHAFSWAVFGDEWPVITSYSDEGVPGLSRHIPIEAAASADGYDSTRGETTEPSDRATPILARHNGCYFAIGNILVFADDQFGLQDFRMHDDITGLSGSIPPSMDTIAITFAQGGKVLWSATGQERWFGSSLINPTVTFTRNDKLVAADARRIEIYDATSGSLGPESQFDSPGTPIALFPVRISEFCILESSGRWSIFPTV